MADEDQERFEDYLELERYIEELQAGRIAHPPADLTPERARLYRIAALFRSAAPKTAEPHPDFVVSLHANLLAEIGESGRDPVRSEQPLVQPEMPLPKEEQPQLSTRVPEKTPKKKARFVSRRSLLSGGAVAAASLVVGSSIGAALEQNGTNNKTAAVNATPTHSIASSPLTGFDQTELYPAATLAEIGKGAVRFTRGGVIGYILMSDGDVGDAPNGEVIAMSAACTHMGCIVEWQDAKRNFYCPCHDGLFTETGQPDKTCPIPYLVSLPRLKTHIRGGTVYVEVPASRKSTTHLPATVDMTVDSEEVICPKPPGSTV